MQTAIRIPHAIVHVERMPLRLMHAMVVAAVVAPTLRDVRHAQQAAIERRIEDAPLLRRPTINPDLAQRSIPCGTTRGLHLLKALPRKLLAKIRLRLIGTEVRDAHANLHRQLRRARKRHLADLPRTLRLPRTRSRGRSRIHALQRTHRLTEMKDSKLLPASLHRLHQFGVARSTQCRLRTPLAGNSRRSIRLVLAVVASTRVPSTSEINE